MTEKHSNVVGGSTAKRTIKCPGWRKLSEQAPRDEGSIYAREGTMLHEVIAQVLGENLDPEKLVGVEVAGVVFTADLLEEKLLPNLDAFDEYAVPHYLEFEVEQRVAIPEIPGAFGTADIIGMDSDDMFCCFDWKFGSGVAVSPEEIDQGLFYTAGALRKPEYKDWVDRCAGVRIGIIQHGRLETWDTTVERVEQFVQELEMAVRLGDSENPPFAMGDHCRFCPCMTICPEHQDLAHAALSADGWGDNLAYWIEHADQLIEFGNAVKNKTHDYMENGGTVPGWKLVAKRARRGWGDAEAAEEFLRRVARRSSNQLKVSELFKHTLLTPAQIEKVFKSEGVALDQLAEYIVNRSSGTTLAPESDSRKEVKLTADRLQEIATRLSASTGS